MPTTKTPCPRHPQPGYCIHCVAGTALDTPAAAARRQQLTLEAAADRRLTLQGRTAEPLAVDEVLDADVLRVLRYDLQGAAAVLEGLSGPQLDRFLAAAGVDTRMRFALKHRLLAQGHLQTDGPNQPPRGALATDRHQRGRELPGLSAALRRAGFEVGRKYTTFEVDDRLRAAGLEPMQRLAAKHELMSLDMLV